MTFHELAGHKPATKHLQLILQRRCSPASTCCRAGRCLCPPAGTGLRLPALSSVWGPAVPGHVESSAWTWWHLASCLSFQSWLTRLRLHDPAPPQGAA